MSYKVRILFVCLFVLCLDCLYANGVWVYDTEDQWNQCGLTHCDTLTNTGSVRILHITDDEFDNSVLNNGWIWQPGVDAAYYMKGTNIEIWTKNSDWICLQDRIVARSCPILCQQFEGDFSIETSILNYFTKKNNEFAGLFIGNLDGYEYIRIGIAADTINVKLFTYSCNAIYDANVFVYNSPCFVKMEKNGTILNTYYKTNNSDPWILSKSYNYINWTKIYGGFFIFDSSGIPGGVNFDYFYYNGQKEFAQADVVSPWIDMGTAPVGQGILRWNQNLFLNTNINLSIQTSDDKINTSGIYGPYSGVQNAGVNITAPNKRYVRFLAELTTSVIGITPILNSVTIEYPTVPPVTPAITSTTHGEGQWSNNPDVGFSWCCSDVNGVTIDAYHRSIDETATSTSTRFELGSNTNNVYFSDGLHYISAIAQADWRNNSLCSNIANYEVKIDTRAPDRPEVLESSHRENETENKNNFYIKISAVDTIGTTNNISGIQGYSYTMTKDGLEPDASIESNDGKIYVNGLDNGTWMFKAKSVDNAGNSSMAMSYTVKVDFKGRILDESYVKVYPTINSGNFTISYDLNASANQVEIELKDTTGKTIKKIDGGTGYGNHSIAQTLSNFPNGVYFAKIKAARTDGKEDLVIKKFVIKK